MDWLFPNVVPFLSVAVAVAVAFPLGWVVGTRHYRARCGRDVAALTTQIQSMADRICGKSDVVSRTAGRHYPEVLR